VKPFGKMDEIQFYRHYINAGSNLACRRNSGGSSDRGSNEGRASPVSGAYAPNSDIYKKTYGNMAQVYSGDRLCWRWPAKNHYGHVNRATNMVYVYWDDVPNRATELSQSALQTKEVARMLFANCPVAGVPSAGDQTGVGSELRPCGGCFTVPSRAPGIYTVQWYWPFHSVTRDPYTSCADIEVLAPRSTANQDCVVSGWSSYSQCSANCGGGKTTRTRTVTTAPTGTGAACPATSETLSCNTQSCTDALSEHVIYDDELRDFVDWSWATTYDLSSTTHVHSGSNSISFQPKNWEGVYFFLPGAGDLADFQAISFWIHGGTTGGQNLQFSPVTIGSPTSKPLFQWTIPRTSIKANTWTKVSLTFGSLGFTKGYFDGIWFQAKGSTTQATVYIDDIYFKHVHAGGAAAQITDECATVACGANAKCVAGACACTDGYAMADDETSSCSIAPTVIDVTVMDMAAQEVTSLDGTDFTLIVWNTTGDIATVNIILQREDNPTALPIPIATHIVNSGEYLWEPPTTLATGTYYVRIEYDSDIFGRSTSMTKTSTEASGCPSVDCNGHGQCDDDTNSTCVCRYGWGGTTCDMAPVDTTRISASVIVDTPYSTVMSDPTTFKTIFRTDMASALLVLSDQIEVVSMSTYSTNQTRVDFTVLMGSEFHPSPFGFNSTTTLTTTLQTMLSTSDSTLNRGVIEFASVVKEDTTPKPSLSAAHATSTPALAIVTLVVASVAAIF
jgi:hypothetical protein